MPEEELPPPNGSQQEVSSGEETPSNVTWA
jgi:hypothetical protein